MAEDVAVVEVYYFIAYFIFIEIYIMAMCKCQYRISIRRFTKRPSLNPIRTLELESDPIRKIQSNLRRH